MNLTNSGDDSESLPDFSAIVHLIVIRSRISRSAAKAGSPGCLESIFRKRWQITDGNGSGSPVDKQSQKRSDAHEGTELAIEAVTRQFHCDTRAALTSKVILPDVRLPTDGLPSSCDV
jgi:hypothetical protein